MPRVILPGVHQFLASGCGWDYFYLNTAGQPFQVKIGPGTLAGFINVGAAQTTLMTAYDGIGQTGNLLASQSALLAGTLLYPANGVNFVLGLNVMILTSIVSPILVLYA